MHTRELARRTNFVYATCPRRGVSMLLLCALFPVVLAISAYCINVVYMELARTELQIATDVAARAAGRVLAVTGDQQLATDAAERMLQVNPYANQVLPLSATNVVFGVSTRRSENERYTFQPGENPNAVQITTNGKASVPMLFPTMGVAVDFRPIKSAISTQTELDISLVIDRSGSMAYSADEISGSSPPTSAAAGWAFGQHVPPNARWLDAVAAVDGFLELMKETNHDEHVSLATYSNTAMLELDLTSNYQLIQDALQQHTVTFNGGSTNIGGGILAGASGLSDKQHARPWATRVMIVLTDGIHNTGTDPIYASQSIAQENVLIYTVSFSAEADIGVMNQIAGIGSGKHIHASTGSELKEAFQEIARSLPTLLTH